MAEPIDPNATRPIITAKVLYRCTCGTDLQLAIDVGGQCHQCQRTITPKIIQHEMAISTICDGSFELYSPNSAGWEDGEQSSTAVETLPSHSAASNPLQRIPLPAEPASQSNNGSSPHGNSLIGQSFGHFELVSHLGQGGMGQVYRALDKSLQRYVAVKILRSSEYQRTSEESSPPSPANGFPEDLPRKKTFNRDVDKLLQEAVTQARLSHPNIVTIYYVGKQDGNPFLAMELVTGKPLSTRIAEEELTFDQIVSIAMQISRALQFSFELDLIHGDIKPSNILIGPNGAAKLSDFGMARNVGQEGGGIVGGTPNYIAPELLLGTKPTVQSDIYALGVTLFEMSFQKVPLKLNGQTVSEWVSTHEAHQPQFPSPWPNRFPEMWKEILLKMLAKNPEDRYSCYQEFIDDLQKVTPRSPVLARPTPRIVAAGIDWISFLMLAVILRIGITYYQWGSVLSNALRIADLLAILVYISLVYFWRQSFGRSLMHIQVVNRHGLRPRPWQMVLRCIMRMQFPWCAVGLLLFADAPFRWMELIISSLLILSAAILLLDLAFMFFNKRRRALHDIIFDTQVVIDIDTASQVRLFP